MELNIPEQDQFSIRNKQKYLQRLSGFLQWLEKQDHAIANIHAPLQRVIKNNSIASEERRKYTCEDLKKLFNSQDYRQGLHETASRFWVPLIALFTGARLNEICQLHTCDIYKHNEADIWVIDINQDASTETLKSIKRGEHSRLVTVQKQVKRLIDQ